jgi:hypothetical protein
MPDVDHRQMAIFSEQTDSSWRGEALVHEMGHIWGQKDQVDGHPAHRNFLNSDGCALLYPTANVWGNSIAQFGGILGTPGEPEDLIAIGRVAQPPGP